MIHNPHMWKTVKTSSSVVQAWLVRASSTETSCEVLVNHSPHFFGADPLFTPWWKSQLGASKCRTPSAPSPSYHFNGFIPNHGRQIYSGEFHITFLWNPAQIQRLFPGSPCSTGATGFFFCPWVQNFAARLVIIAELFKIKTVQLVQPWGCRGSWTTLTNQKRRSCWLAWKQHTLTSSIT